MFEGTATLWRWLRTGSVYWRDPFLKKHPLDGDQIYRLRKPGAADRPAIRTTIELGATDFTFPIDIVFTWVDGNEPEFRRSLAAHTAGLAMDQRLAMSYRFASHDKLRYALRSVSEYAPWCRQIFIVTNGQVPHWLSPSPRLKVVRHEEILSAKYLPTFNSHVIESALQNIEGLAEHYIYFNDDMFLTRPSSPLDFFTDNGLAFFFPTDRWIDSLPPSPRDTDTERAAKNSRILIRRQWQRYPSKMPAHICVPQRKSDAAQNEKRFGEEYHRMRRNLLRAETDLFCTGFLNPYASFLEGHTLMRRIAWARIGMRDPWAVRHYARMLKVRNTNVAPFALNIQDVPAAVELPDFEVRLSAFLKAYFPKQSEFEGAG